MARIPDEEAKAFEIRRREENSEMSAAVPKLLSARVQEWRIRRAVEQLRACQITLRTAARLAGLP